MASVWYTCLQNAAKKNARYWFFFALARLDVHVAFGHQTNHGGVGEHVASVPLRAPVRRQGNVHLRNAGRQAGGTASANATRTSTTLPPKI